MILKGFWETLSKVDPLQCVAGASLRQRSGDPAPTRICCGAEFFKSVCFSNDFEAFSGNPFREPTPEMMRWTPLRQHSGASWKLFVSFVFPTLSRMRALRAARPREAHPGPRRVRSDLLGSGNLQKCLFPMILMRFWTIVTENRSPKCGAGRPSGNIAAPPGKP